MLLKQWSEQSGILPTTPTTEVGAISVVIDHNNEHRPQLFHLADYLVSTCAGVVMWLVPATRMKPGYAYVANMRHPHEEDTETEMIVQSECDNAKWCGTRMLDGLHHNVFRSADGLLYYFQLPC